MKTNKKIIGIIPARGGSKGIPRKNVMSIAGKPLIVWSIEAAKESKLLDDFYVSTEDKEIAAVAEKYGAKVLKRLKELASDDTETIDVLKDILTKIKADAIVLLQPTSPIRSKGLIDECIKIFNEKEADTVVTGFKCDYAEFGTYNTLRQKRKEFFCDDGNIYIQNSKIIIEGRMAGDRIEKVFTSKEENIDIDDYFDFKVAEQILNEKSGRLK